MNPETAVRRVGGWCEMVVSLRGREPGNRGTFTVGRRYLAKTVTESTSLCVIVMCKA
jgi:hypothetical protein